jgi:hypothetical protein
VIFDSRRRNRCEGLGTGLGKLGPLGGEVQVAWTMNEVFSGMYWELEFGVADFIGA